MLETAKKNGGPLTLNLRGRRFGRLLAIRPTEERKGNKVVWECQCDCGNLVYVKSVNLQNGYTQSCGCLRMELLIKRSTIHGLAGTSEYNIIVSRRRRDRKHLYDVEWTLEMEQALKEYQPTCVICGSQKYLSVDHVLPLSKGYGLKPGNAVILCKAHNSQKHTKLLNELPVEWQASIIWSAFRFKDYWLQKELVR